MDKLAAETGNRNLKQSNTAQGMIANAHDRLVDIPIDQRRKRLAKRVPSGEGDHAIDEAVGDMKAGVCDPLVDSRLIQIHPIRPYGVRTRVLAQVADEIANRYSVRVSPGYVADCVEEFRKLLIEL